MKDFKGMFLLLLFGCFYSCAEFQNAYRGKNGYITCRKEINGKWEEFGDYNKKISEPVIWIFNENDTLTINKKLIPYELEDCLRLVINYDGHKIFFNVRQYNDTLYLSQGSFEHESVSARLKRTN